MLNLFCYLVYQEMLLSASISVMGEVVANPERLGKSAYLMAHDPNTVKSELNKAMETFRSRPVQK